MGSGGSTGSGGSADGGNTGTGGTGTGSGGDTGTGGSEMGGATGTGGAGNTGSGWGVVTNRYDNDRTGVNPRETILNTSNVAPGKFGLVFSRLFDGNAYAQPLYVSDLMIGGGKHNVVYVATSTNHVYAFDADDPAAMMPLWEKQVAPLGHVMVDGAKRGQPGYTWCKDMYPFSGISGTPVIDLASNRMYLVSQEGELDKQDTYKLKLHALDLLTGEEVGGGPKVIDATVDGGGAGSNGGKIHMNSWIQFNRTGLLLHKGTIYVGMTSHCDESPYHGWLFAFDPGTLEQKSVFNTSPKSKGGAIWQSGNGIAANDNGLFYCTSNGGTSDDGSALGLSVVRMNADNTMGDWFTPGNADALNGGDKDLTGGVVLIPGSNYLVSGGKEGVAYVIDQKNMTHTGGTIAQRVSAGGEMHAFAFYNNHLYVWPDGKPLKVIPWANDKFDEGGAKTFNGGPSGTPAHPGGMLTISANGTTAGSAILWASMVTSGDAWHNIAKGALVALDADDVSKLLWDSTADKADNVGNFAKFSAPTVANGKVYLTTFANVNATSPSYLRVYGLKN
jgi:hypothetical protein